MFGYSVPAMVIPLNVLSREILHSAFYALSIRLRDLPVNQNALLPIVPRPPLVR